MIFLKVLKSAEDYLERILMLTEKHGRVRSIDIAIDMDFSKPSISVAMKNLREQNLITIDHDGIIRLTEEGEKIARDVYDRHCSVMNFFIEIGVPKDIAEEDACKIEHDISKESITAIKKLLKKLKKEERKD